MAMSSTSGSTIVKPKHAFDGEGELAGDLLNHCQRSSIIREGIGKKIDNVRHDLPSVVFFFFFPFKQSNEEQSREVN